MKYLYYIFQGDNASRFDTLFEKEDILPTVFEASRIQSLTAFIKTERAIAEQNYILIDVGDLTQWSKAHVLSATQYLRRLSRTELIFIGEPCAEVKDLFRVLADVHHVDDLIIAAPDTDISKKLSDCLSPPVKEAATRLETAQKIAQHVAETPVSIPVPDGLTLHVAVAGTMSRCGTTTQALAICHYMKSLGFRPVFCDVTNRMLPFLATYEGVERNDGGITTIRGLDFCTEERSGFNAHVTDFGVVAPENAAQFSHADISVLVGCTKPWEISAYAGVLSMILPYACKHLITLASFSTEAELARLKSYFGEHNGLAPYMPDLWELPKDHRAFEDLLLPEVKRVCAIQEPTPQHSLEPEL